MIDWPEVLLEEIADLTVGFVGKTATHYVDDGIRFLRSMNVEPFRINYNDEKFVDEEFHRTIKKSELNTGDVVIVRTGKPGACAVIPAKTEEWNCSDLVVIKPDSTRINSTFLASYVNLAYGVINAHLVGAVQQHFNVGSARKLKIKLPSIKTQEKIANFIDNINDKIIVNEKINRNLLDQANALYKSWFVDFVPFNAEIPYDWKMGTVDDLAAEIVCGKTPSTKNEEYYGEDVPFVTIPDMHGCVYTVKTERSLSQLGAESQGKKTLPKNSICVSCIGTAGLVVLLSKESQTNQQINSIIPKMDFSPYYIYLMMVTMSETINKLGQSGSTIVNLNKTQFGKMEVLIPSVSVMKDFDEFIEPIFSTILSNQYENMKLVNLRDALLPRLMSGELDVSDLDI